MPSLSKSASACPGVFHSSLAGRKAYWPCQATSLIPKPRFISFVTYGIFQTPPPLSASPEPLCQQPGIWNDWCCSAHWKVGVCLCVCVRDHKSAAGCSNAPHSHKYLWTCLLGQEQSGCMYEGGRWLKGVCFACTHVLFESVDHVTCAQSISTWWVSFFSAWSYDLKSQRLFSSDSGLCLRFRIKIQNQGGKKNKNKRCWHFCSFV